VPGLADARGQNLAGGIADILWRMFI